MTTKGKTGTDKTGVADKAALVDVTETAEYKQLHGRFQVTKEALELLKEQLDEADSKTSDLVEKHQEQVDENTRLASELETLTSQSASSTTDLQDQHDALKKYNEEVAASNENLAEKFAKAETELGKVKAELASKSNTTSDIRYNFDIVDGLLNTIVECFKSETFPTYPRFGTPEHLVAREVFNRMFGKDPEKMPHTFGEFKVFVTNHVREFFYDPKNMKRAIKDTDLARAIEELTARDSGPVELITEYIASNDRDNLNMDKVIGAVKYYSGYAALRPWVEIINDHISVHTGLIAVEWPEEQN